MATRKSTWLPLLAIVSSLLLSATASAQLDDWPVLRGQTSRVGVNGDPLNSGPGQGLLNWFTPSSADSRYTTNLVVDNTDSNTGVGYTNAVGTFTVSGGTVPFPGSSANNIWLMDPLAQNVNANYSDAADPFLEYNPNTVSNEREPGYVYAFGSTQGTTATATATWNFVPPATVPANSPNLYALYVWIPIGPQVGAQGEQFPLRYYSYTIRASGGAVFHDVVDTYLSGGGWIRLGNGGAATNMVFPWDGNPQGVSTDVLSVTLDNSIVVDGSGKPTGTTSQVVYADACEAVPTNGFYNASPVSAQLIPGTVTSTRTVAALNQFSSGGAAGGTLDTLITGVVTSYAYNSPIPIWTYSPVLDGTNSVLSDVGNYSPNPDPWTSDPTLLPIQGAAFAQTTPIVAPGTQNVTTGEYASTASMLYNPTLNTGTYAIYVYVHGSDATHTFGQDLQYVITENGIRIPVLVNQNTASGWVQIGTRRYSNTAATFPLTVQLTNVSIDPANGNDVGQLAYADAVRFVGEQNQGIDSTPVIASTWVYDPILKTEAYTQVVVIADENGVIHCLDATGTGTGSTKEYWSYPSTLGPTDTDPNAGADAGSEMPTGFNMTSGIVVQPPGVPNDALGHPESYLYIGSANGRVYCINMNGNSQATLPSTNIGTTTRVWTYPASPGPVGNLGAFQGSVTYGQPVGGQPTIYVPATQGRIYAIDALGSPSAHSTGTFWEYPFANAPTLGPVYTTPAFAQYNGKSYLYFGTGVNPVDDSNGVFYCFNVSTALTAQAPLWTYAGGTIIDAITLQQIPVNTGDFLSSPSVVTQKLVNAGYSANDGFVYVLNQNNYLYAFDAITGAFASDATSGDPNPIFWNPTNELGVGAVGGLSFTAMTVYTSGGSLTNLVPVVTIPTTDGRFEAMFADPITANVDGTRQAWFYTNLPGPVVAELSMSNSWMYGADQAGFLYAFNNSAGGGNLGNPPGNAGISEDNPAGAEFRNAQVTLVTQQGYNLLRLPKGQNLTYLQAHSSQYSFVRNPLAFEWGETAYLLIDHFPFLTSNGTLTVPPPIVNVTLSSQGKTVRTISVEARQYVTVTAGSDPPFAPDGVTLDDGYAILAFPFQSGGQQSLPPGGGTISISLATSALNTFGAQQTVAQNARNSTFPFYIANPLAISTPDPNLNNSLTLADNLSIGLSTSPSNVENLVNGSPLIPNLPGKNTSLLGASAGIANHGTSITVPVDIIDRSMMALQRPDNTGLDQVRVDVKNLGWQGGHLAIYKRMPVNYYLNFEDYPDNYPNTSIDYPDIQSEQIQVVKDPNGTAQNPRFNSVSLNPPMVKDPGTGQLRQMQPGDHPEWRVFQPTLFNFNINVPRFQPANTNSLQAQAGLAPTPNSAGETLQQGYFGRVRAFVDSNQNGLLDGSPQEAYRAFNLATSVDVDEKLTVSTPTVNLGTLAEGTGFNPLRPGEGAGTQGYTPGIANGQGIFQPWGAGSYASLFQPFVVNNEGNVNLLNVRVAKASNLNGTGATPWGIFSTSNDTLGFLDGSVDLWSDIDTTFAPTGAGQQVALQKARVTDVSPTQLTANIVRRANPNLGTTGSFVAGGNTLPDVLNQTPGAGGVGTLLYPPTAPRVAVSIPIGMPVGSYSQVMRVIEKTQDNKEIWENYLGAPETFTDPTFILNFNVREAQLTTSFTTNTAPMMDNLSPASAALPLTYSNVQPAMVRDSNGGLIVAFSSDRPQWVPTAPTATTQLGNYMIYLGNLNNSSTFTNFGVNGTLDALSPLSDLDSFVNASNSQWFNQSGAGYPSQPADVLFGSLAGDAVIANTAQYGNPSFPNAGLANPFAPGQSFQSMFMAFTGSAQKQTPSGRLGESALFITTVSPSHGGTINTPPQPVALLSNPQVQKGKPSVLQTSTSAMVFYPGVAGGVSDVYYSLFNGTSFGPSVALPFGRGFESVTGVSASGRIYAGLGEMYPGTTTTYLPSGTGLAELTFTGQLKGRSFPEVFFGRLPLNASYSAVVDDAGVAIDNPATDGRAFIDLPQMSNEILVATGQPGEYRSLGVQWDVTTPIVIQQSLNGAAPTNILVPNSETYDQQTGIIAFDTLLGGKVYIDTTLGTVRFASNPPSANAQILATYMAKFIRVSASANGLCSRPTGLFDNREISNPTYWRRPNGANADFTDDLKSGRYVFTYNRTATAAAALSRPYISTARLGVQLTFRIATDNNGNPLPVSVQGIGRASAGYQIDSANGRIYFTSADEDNTVKVTYTALKEDGTTFVWTDQEPVSLVQETNEQQILIDGAVNESDLTAFLDPFSYVAQRRPPMMWLFWTSSRVGTPNIFFETISPQWSPIPIGQ